VYAVIEDSGQQFRVSEGDVLRVDLRDLPEDAQTVEFDRVLLVGGKGEAKIGTPLLNGAKVTAEIVKRLDPGPKVHIYKLRRRKASRRKVGHRQKYMQVRVTKIAV